MSRKEVQQHQSNCKRIVSMENVYFSIVHFFHIQKNINYLHTYIHRERKKHTNIHELQTITARYIVLSFVNVWFRGIVDSLIRYRNFECFNIDKYCCHWLPTIEFVYACVWYVISIDDFLAKYDLHRRIR